MPVADHSLPKTVLVTGGSGFIGSNLLVELVPRYPDIRFVNLDALTHAAVPGSLAPIESSANYGFIRVDLADADAVSKAVEEVSPELVLHLAAQTHVDRSIKDPRETFAANALGTFNLLESCRRLWKGKQGRFHHVSTDEVYGSLGDDGAFTEETPYSPRSPYSSTKAASDHFVRAYHETFGMDVSLTNCSNNYGPRQNPEKLLPLTIFRAMRGESIPIYGTGGNVRDWLYVRDHVEAIWQVATRGRSGETYNVGGNCERRNLEVVDALLEVIAHETGKSLAGLTSLIRFVEDRPGHDWRYAIDASKIKRDLGWAPTRKLADGLRETVRWYLNNPDWVLAASNEDYGKWVQSQYQNPSLGESK